MAAVGLPVMAAITAAAAAAASGLTAAAARTAAGVTHQQIDDLFGFVRTGGEHRLAAAVTCGTQPLAEAFGRDTEFFGFIRSLQAYETSLKGTNSSIVMQPDSEFFSYLRGAGVEGAAPQPSETPEPAADTAAAPASP